jgi:diguanylate cyclase (GGDEF)-like protein
LIESPTDPAITALMPNAQNVVVLPLAAGEDVLGVVIAEWRRGRRARVPMATLDSLTQAAAHGSLTLHNALLMTRLAEQATHDPLTGLANRKLFEEILEREVKRWERTGRPVALMAIDVDNFKAVNDTFGHAAGDEVLRLVADALATGSRQVDVVARLGGDEFAVVLPDCTGADALGAAERLRADVVAKQRSASGARISVGVAGIPENALDRAELSAAADGALYEAKQRGRDCAVRSTRDALAGTDEPDPAAIG